MMRFPNRGRRADRARWQWLATEVRAEAREWRPHGRPVPVPKYTQAEAIYALRNMGIRGLGEGRTNFGMAQVTP